jgi:hypothetical protein
MNRTLCCLVFLGVSSTVALSQGFGGGGPSMKKTEESLDSANAILKKIGILSKGSLSIAKSTNTLYKRSFDLSEDLIRSSRTSSELTKQLVLLAEDNKKSSDLMQSLTLQLTYLTWVLVLIALLQTIFFVVQLRMTRSKQRATLERNVYSDSLVHPHYKRPIKEGLGRRRGPFRAP